MITRSSVYPVPSLRRDPRGLAPLSAACAPLTDASVSLTVFWFSKNTFLEGHVTTRQPTMMQIG